MKKTTFLSFITIIFFGFLLTGCQNDEISYPFSKNEIQSKSKISDPQIIKELQFLKNEGTISSDTYEQLIKMDMPIKLENGDEVYPICIGSGCDELLSREYVQNRIREKETTTNQAYRHRRHTNMYAGGTILVSVKANSTCAVPSSWATAIQEAISVWNNLGYNIKFAGSSGTTCSDLIGYINVSMGNTGLGSSNVAATQLPSSAGSFGKYILINTAYTGTGLTTSAKKFAMAHELGHAIGLRHTDSGDANDVYSGISCYGSTSYTDPNSVFKSIIPYNQAWTDFTTCDKTVINYYW